MARNPNTRDDVARPQDAKPRVRRADDQICLGQRNDAAPSNHASPQKTGRQPSALFSSQKSQAVKPFLVCCCPLCFLCLLSDRLKLAFINAIYFKKGTGKRGAATAAGEQRRQGSSSKGSICANDTQTRIFGKQQERLPHGGSSSSQGSQTAKQGQPGGQASFHQRHQIHHNRVQ